MTVGPEKNKEFRVILGSMGLDVSKYEQHGQIPPSEARELAEKIEALEPKLKKMDPWVMEMAKAWRHSLGRGAAMRYGTIFI
jgi:hypothetical protein